MNLLLPSFLSAWVADLIVSLCTGRGSYIGRYIGRSSHKISHKIFTRHYCNRRRACMGNKLEDQELKGMEWNWENKGERKGDSVAAEVMQRKDKRKNRMGCNEPTNLFYHDDLNSSQHFPSHHLDNLRLLNLNCLPDFSMGKDCCVLGLWFGTILLLLYQILPRYIQFAFKNVSRNGFRMLGNVRKMNSNCGMEWNENCGFGKASVIFCLLVCPNFYATRTIILFARVN